MAKQLIVRTVQLAQWRKVPGCELLDVTVKSGDKAFAPTWDMVNSYRNGLLTEEDYIKRYTHLMSVTQHTHEESWQAVLDMSRVALACYCPACAVFCHRWLLVDCLIAYGDMHGVDVLYEGEVQ